MTNLTNFIRGEANGTLTGIIASLADEIDVTGEPFESANAKAPTYRLFAKTPRGRRIPFDFPLQ